MVGDGYGWKGTKGPEGWSPQISRRISPGVVTKTHFGWGVLPIECKFHSKSSTAEHYHFSSSHKDYVPQSLVPSCVYPDFPNRTRAEDVVLPRPSYAPMTQGHTMFTLRTFCHSTYPTSTQPRIVRKKDFIIYEPVSLRVLYRLPRLQTGDLKTWWRVPCLVLWGLFTVSPHDS